MSHCFKYKFNPNHNDFSKQKPMSVICLDFIFPPVSSQRPVHSIYCTLSSISDPVSRTVLLTKLLLSDVYLNWFPIYFLIAKFCVNFRNILLLKIFGGPTGTCLGPSVFSILFAEICYVIKLS